MSSIRTILVATDFSTDAAKALDFATSLAKDLGARIHLLHAFDLPLHLVSPYEVAIPDVYFQDCRSAAATRLAAALQQVRDAGVEADSRLSEVPAVQAITAEAKASRADLIVMGTRGNTGVKHVLMGSVAERTVRLAPCPVLAVKADDD
jgi:nucleotide-binding universal stress UspA family protein